MSTPSQEGPPVRGRFVVSEEAGSRLDHALLPRLAPLSRSAIQRLIAAGHILLNGKRTRPAAVLRAGDEVSWEIPPPQPSPLIPEPIPLEIVYEDEDLLVINKPKGLIVHPAPGAPAGTLVHAVLAHAGEELAGIGGEERPGIVHRLDRDTSGLMVIAKTELAYRSLQRQIQERTVERRYVAVVRGNPRFERAVVDAPIGRHPRERQRMAVIPLGSRYPAREARTELRVLERFPGFALLEARLETGRTHQIRVHCAYIGHPIIGDPVYGSGRRIGDGGVSPAVRAAIERLQGQALHAYYLAFTHPRTGERRLCTAPPPADTQALLEALGSRWQPTPTGAAPGCYPMCRDGAER
ncbi:MAG: RluA family pseudouridine synthase [Armatimonadetes bacterium]|nr:RluA family pseudouridine synthase [Armatimonadota bacterium]